jgi:PAS domain S-box-containing protein
MILSNLIFEGGEEVIFVESWQRRKDGQIWLLSWLCRVLKDDHGEVMGVISSAQDITEREKAETALRENARFLQILLDSIPVPIF